MIRQASSGTATAAASLVEFDEEAGGHHIHPHGLQVDELPQDFLSMGMPEEPLGGRVRIRALLRGQ